MAAFATAEDLATQYQLNLNAAETATATQCLDLATGFIKGYTDQNIESAAYTEIFRGGSILVVRQIPVTAVATFTVDAVAYTDYDVDWGAGVFYRLDGLNWLTSNIVSIAYTAGWNPVPPTVKGVCLRMAAAMMGNPADAESHSYGGISMTWPTQHMDLKILDRYRA